MQDYQKKGYLVSDFRVFRLTDAKPQPIPFHYHDFHKIILFLGGTVDYVIEGKTYSLRPSDLIFVTAGEIHCPVFHPGPAPYERIVIYISPDFLARWQAESGKEQADLAACFQQARETASVMHQPPGTSHDLLYHMNKLEKTAHGEGFANELYTKILFVEFMILVNRSLAEHELSAMENASYDPKIQQVLSYIGTHLTEPLTVEHLAAQAFLSKFYLMRKFKADTGYGLHQYIRSKRLLLARDLLKTDTPITEIAGCVGFSDYSTFSRAFKAMFHTTPREFRNMMAH